jgi:hypothetical protein
MPAEVEIQGLEEVVDVSFLWFVMAGLVPAIHALRQLAMFKAWMPATSAGMTRPYSCRTPACPTLPSRKVVGARAVCRKFVVGSTLDRKMCRAAASIRRKVDVLACFSIYSARQVS